MRGVLLASRFMMMLLFSCWLGGVAFAANPETKELDSGKNRTASSKEAAQEEYKVTLP